MLPPSPMKCLRFIQQNWVKCRACSGASHTFAQNRFHVVLKNVASSFVGSTTFLIAGTILIFVFIGALVGGLVSAAAGGDASEQEAVSKANTVLTIDFRPPISERSTNDANFDLTGFQSNSTMGLRDFTEVIQRRQKTRMSKACT